MSKRVLLLEHNDVERDLWQKALQKAGYKADVVSTGTEAIASFVSRLADHTPHDVIILDCNMSNEEGQKTTEFIRSIEKEYHRIKAPEYVRIVGFNSNVAFGKMDGWKLGMSDVVYKPIGREDFLRVLKVSM